MYKILVSAGLSNSVVPRLLGYVPVKEGDFHFAFILCSVPRNMNSEGPMVKTLNLQS